MKIPIIGGPGHGRIWQGKPLPAIRIPVLKRRALQAEPATDAPPLASEMPVADYGLQRVYFAPMDRVPVEIAVYIREVDMLDAPTMVAAWLVERWNEEANG